MPGGGEGGGNHQVVPTDRISRSKPPALQSTAAGRASATSRSQYALTGAGALSALLSTMMSFFATPQWGCFRQAMGGATELGPARYSRDAVSSQNIVLKFGTSGPARVVRTNM